MLSYSLMISFLLTYSFYLLSYSADDDYSTTFDLDDSYLYGSFEDYDSVTFTLTVSDDDVVDFWVMSEGDYDDWESDDKISTVKMYTSSYHNNIHGMTYTFDLPEDDTTYYWIVSGLFTGDSTLEGTISIEYYGDGKYTKASESSDSTCFSSDATVNVKGKGVTSIGDVKISDEILAMNGMGDYVFSPVVYLPHAAVNKRHAQFTRVEFGNSSEEKLELTPDHLIFACVDGTQACSTCSLHGMKLMKASQLSTEMCLPSVQVEEESDSCFSATSVSLWKPITTIKPVYKRGIYTVVTMAPYPVVNGIVASPFGYNHFFPNTYYHLHRLVYWLSQSTKMSPILKHLNHLFDQVANSPLVKELL